MIFQSLGVFLDLFKPGKNGLHTWALLTGLGADVALACQLRGIHEGDGVDLGGGLKRPDESSPWDPRSTAVVARGFSFPREATDG